MGIPSFAFSFLVFYFLVFGIVVILLTYGGLSSYIATDLNIQEPKLVTFSGNPLGTLIWIGENITFMFYVALFNPFSQWAILGQFFTVLTIIFAICLILIIRG